jgi:hypothetical protein
MMREVRTARSRFLLCELSVADPGYPKYPRQPVARCDGYRPRGDADGTDPPDRPGEDVSGPRDEAS